jgi:hypothetical protein
MDMSKKILDILQNHGDAVVMVHRLQAALEKTQVGVNHIATYRTAAWPDYGTPHDAALQKLGAGQTYDMWCCWNATMTARDELDAL